MSLVERFADDITLEYSLIDRLRVRGHVLNLQTITMLRTYFQQVHHVEWIEPRDLQRLTDERGVVTYYEYDSLNRLVLLRQDENGLALELWNAVCFQSVFQCPRSVGISQSRFTASRA